MTAEGFRQKAQRPGTEAAQFRHRVCPHSFMAASTGAPRQMRHCHAAAADSAASAACARSCNNMQKPGQQRL